MVKGDQVTANVGGNLNIESLQDKNQYREKSQQVGGSVTFGPSPGGSPKVYGSQQTTINARDLQRDINAGTVSQDIKIVTNQQLVKELQVKVDAARKRFDANPSDNNLRELKRAQETLDFGKRDGECLIKGCVPAPYLTPPTAPVTPIVPLPKLPTTPNTPSGPTKPGS